MKQKTYPLLENTTHSSIINEPLVAYGAIDDGNAFDLINLIRKGLNYKRFESLLNHATFTLSEWASYLHLSERTIQRYESENKTFDIMQSEKIVQIAMLYKYGTTVFGNSENFDTWLKSKNIAMGGILPKSLLDSSLGIELIKDELGRIEHGVLA